MDYYAKMEGSFDAAADTEAAARSKRSRLAASAAVMAAEDSAAAASSSAAVGQQQAGHHQRRLWVKDRSRAWWDKCSSPDYLEWRRTFGAPCGWALSVTLQLATAVLSLVAFSVIASAQTSGWAGDSYARHQQYRSVIATCSHVSSRPGFLLPVSSDVSGL